MHHISIILVNHNTSELTNDCLESLSTVSVKHAEIDIILVDNGSQIPYQLPAKYANTVTLLRSGANLGFTGGNNLGIHHAIETHNSDYILLLNNDTFVQPDFLQHLYDALEHDENSGLACPKIYFAPGREYHYDSYSKSDRGKVLWYAGGSIDWNNLVGFHRGVDEVDRNHFSHQSESEFATGCALLIKREVLEKVGLLDKRYFLYFEDADLSMKAKLFGYTIKFCDQAIIWHVNAGSSDGAGSPVHQYYQTRNRFLFFWQYGKLRSKLTVLRLVYRCIFKGSEMERTGALHFVLRQFGKQPIV